MASLLIIGGSGFFGKSFVDYYNLIGFKQWGINNLFITSRTNQIINGHQTLFYDSVNFSPLNEVDYIIYAASANESQTYDTNFEKEIDSQKRGMDNFQKLLSTFNKPPIKILYTSSGAVYGQNNLNNYKTSESSTIPEPDDNNRIKKVYANIKIDWEEFLLQNYPEQALIARCFAFVGSRLPLDKHFVMGNFILNYIQGNIIDVNAKNLVYRSYMYADDLVEWLLTILTSSKKLKDNIFNVGSNEEIEIHDLANIFMKKLNANSPYFLAQEKNIDRYVPDITYATKTFSLMLKYNLSQSINKTIELLTLSKK